MTSDSIPKTHFLKKEKALETFACLKPKKVLGQKNGAVYNPAPKRKAHPGNTTSKPRTQKKDTQTKG